MNQFATKCRACGATIMFLKTAKGKTMPVDEGAVFFKAHPDGKELFILGDGSTMRGNQVSDRAEGDQFGYISHFATCPAAGMFRERGKKARKAAVNDG